MPLIAYAVAFPVAMRSCLYLGNQKALLTIMLSARELLNDMDTKLSFCQGI